MARTTCGLAAALLFGLGTGLAAQTDPVAGQWRGTLTSAQGADSPIILTIERRGDGYTGVTSGLNEGGDAPLSMVTVTGNSVAFESAAESELGRVLLSGDLMADGNAMKGSGTLAVGAQRFPVTLTLQRGATSRSLRSSAASTISWEPGTSSTWAASFHRSASAAAAAPPPSREPAPRTSLPAR